MDDLCKIISGYVKLENVIVPDITFSMEANIFIETARLQNIGFPTNHLDLKGNPIFSNHVLLVDNHIVGYVGIRINNNLPKFILVDKNNTYLGELFDTEISIIGIKIPGDTGWYAFDKKYRRKR